MAPRINIIAAVASNSVMGRDGGLPWRLPEDLAHFKRTTLGSPIIMGRRTWDSLKRPLPGRLNVVISRQALQLPAGVFHASSLDEALAAVPQEMAEVFIVGGRQIYDLAWDRTDRLIVSLLRTAFEGDTRFPPIDCCMWKEVAREAHDEASIPFDIVWYERSEACDAGEGEKHG